MTKEKLAEEIRTRYGKIKRARGNFLYTEKGIRLTDLYRENGTAILGWGGDSQWTIFKNVLSRGLTGSFFTDFDYQLEKSISSLLNSRRKLVVFCSMNEAVSFISENNLGTAEIYKPFSQEKDFSQFDLILFQPPLPWIENMAFLVAKADFFDGKIGPLLSKSSENEKNSFLKGIIKLNAPLQAAAARSIYNIIAAEKKLQEKDFFIFDKFLTPFFERKGPYLFPKCEKESYDDFVLKCLDSGIVIAPSHSETSIVPIGCDKNILQKLGELK